MYYGENQKPRLKISPEPGQEPPPLPEWLQIPYLVPVKGYSFEIIPDSCANPRTRSGDGLYDQVKRIVGSCQCPTRLLEFIGTDFPHSLACEMPAHEAHAHEAYASETDEHCAVFTVRHLLPHRITLSPTSLPPHEHLLLPTRAYCPPRVPVASHENLLPTTNTLLPPTRTCYLYLPPRFRDLSKEIPESKDTLENRFKIH